MIRSILARLLGIDQIERVYEALQLMGDRPIAERLLRFLSVCCAVSDPDLQRIPRTGAAIVTANHPFGILDGAALAATLGRVRSDVRFLANGILTAIPELRDLILPVDPVTGRGAVSANGSGLRRSLEHLEKGGMLVVFPAGEVSHLEWSRRVVSDPPWNRAVARIVAITARRGLAAPVVPAYIDGSNSALFQVAGLAHPRFRTALLARELLNKRGRRVEIRVGTPVASDKLLAIPNAREQVDYLRCRTYLLAPRRAAEPLGSTHMPIAQPVERAVTAGEIGALPAEALLIRTGELEVYLAAASQIPKTLLEIGRLREITFRAAGEGTGAPRDIDRFDGHYLHLFVWNGERQEIVGGYRLAPTETARKRGLYTETLFHYRREFLDRLGPAVELGRSFVRPEYQKGFAPLLVLWKGIGTFIARNPQYKNLFGPVSISNQYAARSRELMVGFLEKYAMLRGWAEMVRGRTPLRRQLREDGLPSAGIGVDDLAEILTDVEQKQTGIPVLLRQYLRLGGKLLGFNVDPKFANALDGLILVDLTKTEPKLLERYLGRTEAATFLAFQKGQNGTFETASLDKLGAAAHRRGDSAADALL